MSLTRFSSRLNKQLSPLCVVCTKKGRAHARPFDSIPTATLTVLGEFLLFCIRYTCAMMNRILEPELMEDMQQALAYAHADFATSHQLRVTWFHERFGMGSQPASILDLCCGGGDMTFRFARAFPSARIVAVDGSQAMLDIAIQDVKAEPELGGRIQFTKAFLPSDDIPQRNYDLVMSHSALHHFHNPLALWETIRVHARPRTMVFVSDLRRVETTLAFPYVLGNQQIAALDDVIPIFFGWRTLIEIPELVMYFPIV